MGISTWSIGTNEWFGPESVLDFIVTPDRSMAGKSVGGSSSEVGGAMVGVPVCAEAGDEGSAAGLGSMFLNFWPRNPIKVRFVI